MNTATKQQSWPVRRILCDWQMPEFLDRIEFDVEYFADRLAEVGAEVVTFTSKSAFGNALYPTDVGRRNRSLPDGIDLFGDVCEAVRKRGIRFIAYFNVLLDYNTEGTRAGWLQRDAHGEALAFENYPMFCMSSNQYRDWLTSHLIEIPDRYPVDGIMLDIQYWHAKGCFCDACRAGFLEATGRILEPGTFGPAEWLDLYRYQETTRRDFLLHLKAEADVVRDGMEWSWNSSGNMSPDFLLDAELTSYGTEAHPPGYDLCSAKSKWMNATGKWYELWMPESIGSWGHHTVTTLATLKGTSALALANGGGVTVNHAPVPAGDYGGRVFPAVYDTIDRLFDWIADRESLCREGVSIAPYALLHSGTNTRIERSRRSARASGSDAFTDIVLGQAATVTGVSILDSTQVLFDVVADEAMLADGIPGFKPPKRLADYGCLILPNVAAMSETTADLIRRYVSDGGRLVSLYHSSLYKETGVRRDNFLLADVLGVDFAGYSDYTIGYLDRFSEELEGLLPDIPLLFKDTGYQQPGNNPPLTVTERDGAEVLATITDPLIEADWSNRRHIFHDHAPQGWRTNRPGIVRNRYGKGVSIHLSLPLLESYAHRPSPWYRALLSGLIGAAGAPQSPVTVEGPGSIRVVARERHGDWYVHLIRVQQETGGILLDDTGSAEVKITLAPPRKVRRAEDALTGKQLAFDFETDDAVALVVHVIDHSIVHIELEE